MSKIVLVGIHLSNHDGGYSDKVYDFNNDCEFEIKKGDRVFVKIGTGGTTDGIVEYVQEKERAKGISYKKIVEVINYQKKQDVLQEGNVYICDIRIWRNQWSAEGGYSEQWSDLTEKCLYDISKEIKIGDIVFYEGAKAKVVNLRQISKKKTLKLKYIDFPKATPKLNVRNIFNKIFWKK